MSPHGSDVVGEVEPLAALQAIVHSCLNVIPGGGDGDRGLIGGRGVTGGGLELLQGAVDGIALARSRDFSQRTQCQHQRKRLVGRQPQRSGEVIGVAQMNDALTVHRIHVDVDQVAGVSPGMPHPQHAEVLAQCLEGDAERGRHVGHRYAVVFA